ncbi:hypothetical protein [Flavobacterium bizetiae]|uniref:hypothetical protein n=1 Tax=Flavobacterium bizetiae TaxID=2704140 RepID=UPI0037575546
MKINSFNIITIIISIVALVISYLSWSVSKQSLDYEIGKDSAINTPAIKEIIDSTKITYKLNNASELQNLNVTFPKSISDENININTKPIELYKNPIESLAKIYLRNKLSLKDSTSIVGTFSIPVMMSYSVIVYGQPHILRENRLLVFKINYYDNVENVEYSNSFLIKRAGYPLLRHYYFTGPFTEPLGKKVQNQDLIDVQELLESQLKDIAENLNK